MPQGQPPVVSDSFSGAQTTNMTHLRRYASQLQYGESSYVGNQTQSVPQHYQQVNSGNAQSQAMPPSYGAFTNLGNSQSLQGNSVGYPRTSNSYAGKTSAGHGSYTGGYSRLIAQQGVNPALNSQTARNSALPQQVVNPYVNMDQNSRLSQQAVNPYAHTYANRRAQVTIGSNIRGSVPVYRRADSNLQVNQNFGLNQHGVALSQQRFISNGQAVNQTAALPSQRRSSVDLSQNSAMVQQNQTVESREASLREALLYEMLSQMEQDRNPKLPVPAKRNLNSENGVAFDWIKFPRIGSVHSVSDHQAGQCQSKIDLPFEKTNQTGRSGLGNTESSQGSDFLRSKMSIAKLAKQILNGKFDRLLSAGYDANQLNSSSSTPLLNKASSVEEGIESPEVGFPRSDSCPSVESLEPSFNAREARHDSAVTELANQITSGVFDEYLNMMELSLNKNLQNLTHPRQHTSNRSNQTASTISAGTSTFGQVNSAILQTRNESLANQLSNNTPSIVSGNRTHPQSVDFVANRQGPSCSQFANRSANLSMQTTNLNAGRSNPNYRMHGSTLTPHRGANRSDQSLDTPLVPRSRMLAVQPIRSTLINNRDVANLLSSNINLEPDRFRRCSSASESPREVSSGGDFPTVGVGVDIQANEMNKTSRETATDGSCDANKERKDSSSSDDDVIITKVTTKEAERGPVDVVDVEEWMPSENLLEAINIKKEPMDKDDGASDCQRFKDNSTIAETSVCTNTETTALDNHTRNCENNSIVCHNSRTVISNDEMSGLQELRSIAENLSVNNESSAVDRPLLRVSADASGERKSVEDLKTLAKAVLINSRSSAVGETRTRSTVVSVVSNTRENVVNDIGNNAVLVSSVIADGVNVMETTDITAITSQGVIAANIVPNAVTEVETAAKSDVTNTEANIVNSPRTNAAAASSAGSNRASGADDVCVHIDNAATVSTINTETRDSPLLSENQVERNMEARQKSASLVNSREGISDVKSMSGSTGQVGESNRSNVVRHRYSILPPQKSNYRYKRTYEDVERSLERTRDKLESEDIVWKRKLLISLEQKLLKDLTKFIKRTTSTVDSSGDEDQYGCDSLANSPLADTSIPQLDNITKCDLTQTELSQQTQNIGILELESDTTSKSVSLTPCLILQVPKIASMPQSEEAREPLDCEPKSEDLLKSVTESDEGVTEAGKNNPEDRQSQHEGCSSESVSVIVKTERTRSSDDCDNNITLEDAIRSVLYEEQQIRDQNNQEDIQQDAIETLSKSDVFKSHSVNSQSQSVSQPQSEYEREIQMEDRLFQLSNPELNVGKTAELEEGSSSDNLSHIYRDTNDNSRQLFQGEVNLVDKNQQPSDTDRNEGSYTQENSENGRQLSRGAINDTMLVPEINVRKEKEESKGQLINLLHSKIPEQQLDKEMELQDQMNDFLNSTISEQQLEKEPKEKIDDFFHRTTPEHQSETDDLFHIKVKEVRIEEEVGQGNKSDLGGKEQVVCQVNRSEPLGLNHDSTGFTDREENRKVNESEGSSCQKENDSHFETEDDDLYSDISDDDVDDFLDMVPAEVQNTVYEEKKELFSLQKASRKNVSSTKSNLSTEATNVINRNLQSSEPRRIESSQTIPKGTEQLREGSSPGKRKSPNHVEGSEESNKRSKLEESEDRNRNIWTFIKSKGLFR